MRGRLRAGNLEREEEEGKGERSARGKVKRRKGEVCRQAKTEERGPGERLRKEESVNESVWLGWRCQR